MDVTTGRLKMMENPNGHQWVRDEDGAIDIWVVNTGHHNGPGCVLCDESFCWHCDPKRLTEDCPAKIKAEPTEESK